MEDNALLPLIMNRLLHIFETLVAFVQGKRDVVGILASYIFVLTNFSMHSILAFFV